MILSVTPNTGLDRVLFVEHLALGKTIRAHDDTWGMGGKTTDASLVLGELDEPNIATGFAAGETGARMVRMLEQHPATTCDFVWVDGETRTNYVLIDTAQRGQCTITVSGLRVRSDHVDQLTELVRRSLSGVACVMMGGSLPQGAPPRLYADLIRLCHSSNVPVILDASGPAFREGVSALPTVLKPNLDELQDLVGRELGSPQEVLRAARELVALGIELVVATLGAEGLWAVSQSQIIHIPALPITPVNTAGAGDALVAGIAAGIARGWAWREGLRLGVAAAGAVCLTPGTAVCRRSDVERLVPQVEVVDGAAGREFAE